MWTESKCFQTCAGMNNAAFVQVVHVKFRTAKFRKFTDFKHFVITEIHCCPDTAETFIMGWTSPIKCLTIPFRFQRFLTMQVSERNMKPNNNKMWKINLDFDIIYNRLDMIMACIKLSPDDHTYTIK